MADILHHFPIRASARRVFAAMTSPAGLDAWWTKRSSGHAAEGEEYLLDFGPGYEWRAVVTKCNPDTEFEWRMTHADQDWTGSLVGFRLTEKDGRTQVSFYHRNWAEANQHFCISSYCWAMYLRLLRRHIELGELVPYEERLDA